MRWVYAWNMKDAFDQFGTHLNRIISNLERKAEQPMDFCLFSQKNLLLSTGDFSEPAPQIMIGHAFRIKGYHFPLSLLEDGYPWYWFLLQSKSTNRLEFRKVPKRGGEAIKEFIQETNAKSDYRGVIIRLGNKGVLRFSPN